MKPVEVLVVEDDAGDAYLIAQVLTDCPRPVKLHLARDGMQALLMLASDALNPDLVIVDLNIPNISGHHVIERFHPHDVPVVAFSSSLDQADEQRALAMGAREFVRKPLHIKAFRDAVWGIVEKWTVPRRADATEGTVG